MKQRPFTVAICGFMGPNYPVISSLVTELREAAEFDPVWVPLYDHEVAEGRREPFVPPGIRCQPLRFTASTSSPSPEEKAAEGTSGGHGIWAGCNAMHRSTTALVARHRSDALIREYRRWEQAYAHWLDTAAPDFILLAEDTDYVRGALLSRLCAHRVPTAVVLSTYYSIMSCYPLRSPGRAMRYYVSHEIGFQKLLRSGIEPARIRWLRNPNAMSVRRVPRQSKRLLWVLQNVAVEPDVMGCLHRILTLIEGWELWIKPHPAAPETGFVRAHPRIRILPAHACAYETFSEVDGVLGESSSLLFAAERMGLPTLQVNFRGFPPAFTTAQKPVTCYTELESRVRSWLNDPLLPIPTFHGREEEDPISCLREFLAKESKTCFPSLNGIVKNAAPTEFIGSESTAMT